MCAVTCCHAELISAKMLRMKRLIWIVGLIGISAAACAQTQQQVEQALKNALEKKSFCVRGFSADDVVNFRWNGTEMALPSPTFRTLGVITVSSVKLSQDTLVINGERHTILKKADNSLAVSGEHSTVSLRVAWQGADVASLVKVPSALFYKNLQEEIDDLPPDFRYVLPSRELEITRDKLKLKPLPSDPALMCDCSNNDEKNCGHRPGSPGWIWPKVDKTQSPDLQVTYNGYLNIKGGFSSFTLRVGADGHTSDFWLGRPLGNGIDIRVLDSLKKWVFFPASCHGVSVASTITINNNFGMR
jgi:hypothetical protein